MSQSGNRKGVLVKGIVENERLLKAMRRNGVRHLRFQGEESSHLHPPCTTNPFADKYICICIYLSIYLSLSLSIYIYTHSVCMYACMYMCVCVYIYIYIHMYISDAQAKVAARRSRKIGRCSAEDFFVFLRLFYY